ncbi:MAG: 50S ribosomal protein L15 [Sandaracinaceae bacterium]
MADNERDDEETAQVPILSRLRPPPGAVRRRRRKGRGPASGLGKTAGRGQKGQKARKPGNIKKLGFEGGQKPLWRKIPKRGFTNPFTTVVAEVNLRDLLKFDEGTTVDVDTLVARGIVKGRFDVVKVLGNGDLDRKLTVRVHRFSASAKAKIEAAGGTAELLVTAPEPAGADVEAAPASE